MCCFGKVEDRSRCFPVNFTKFCRAALRNSSRCTFGKIWRHLIFLLLLFSRLLILRLLLLSFCLALVASKSVQSRSVKNCQITEDMYLADCLEAEGSKRLTIMEIFNITHKCKDAYQKLFKECLK